MRDISVDASLAIGMTVIYAGMDLEQASDEIAAAGFQAAEVFVTHLGQHVVDHAGPGSSCHDGPGGTGPAATPRVHPELHHRFLRPVQER